MNISLKSMLLFAGFLVAFAMGVSLMPMVEVGIIADLIALSINFVGLIALVLRSTPTPQQPSCKPL
jgi:hypothetical protein